MASTATAVVCASSPLANREVTDTSSFDSADPFPSSPSWHFPGPSSKYHQRERPRSHHTRFNSTTTPIGPILSTERRATHRRTQSSNPVHVVDLTRSPLGRFHSYTGGGAARSTTSSSSSSNSNMAAVVPMTPVKSPRPFSRQLRDSPFSDYFTDDGRSLDNAKAASYQAPTPETQRILVRLNKLQAQLMRNENPNEALDVVERKIGEIDSELDALHNPSSVESSRHMQDSGLFMEDDMRDSTYEATNEHDETTGLGLSSSVNALDAKRENISSAKTDAQNHWILKELQNTLEAVTSANRGLRQRYRELRELNDEHILQIEEQEQQLEHLRSENEALKSDLGFDHSELLFLKLQIKGLEAEVDELVDHTESHYTSEQNSQRSPRGRLQEEMDRWRRDWQDVDARFKDRRSAYSGSFREPGVTTPLEKAAASAADFAKEQQQYEGSNDWKLETVKKPAHGRVQSITIRRLDFSAEAGLPSDLEDTPVANKVKLDTASTVEEVQQPSKEYRDTETQTIVTYPSPAIEENHDDEDSISTVQDDEDTESSDDDTNSIKYSYSIPSSIPPLIIEDENGDAVSECAITTSASSMASSPVSSPTLSAVDYFDSSHKTAWQDLWDNLASFAGMGEDPI